MKPFHVEVKDNSEFESQTLTQPEMREKDKNDNEVITQRRCVNPVTLKRGKWIRILGEDRVRWANIFAKCPWAEVRVVLNTEKESAENFVGDVLNPAIPGVAALADEPPPAKPGK